MGIRLVYIPRALKVKSTVNNDNRIDMKTNKILDSIRENTPLDVNKRVDLCVGISNRVFELLEERGLSQRDFAKMLGKTETEVSRWLSGTHNLTIATIAKMAVVLGDDIITPTIRQVKYYIPQEEFEHGGLFAAEGSQGKRYKSPES